MVPGKAAPDSTWPCTPMQATKSEYQGGAQLPLPPPCLTSPPVTQVLTKALNQAPASLSSRLQSSSQPPAECSWSAPWAPPMLGTPAFSPKSSFPPWAGISEGSNWPVGGEKLSQWLVIYQDGKHFPWHNALWWDWPRSEGNAYSTKRIRCLKLPLSIN